MREKNIDQREAKMDNQAIAIYFENATGWSDGNSCLY